MRDKRARREGVREGLAERGTEEARQRVRQSLVTFVRATVREVQFDRQRVGLVVEPDEGYALQRVTHRGPKFGSRAARFTLRIAPASMLPRPSGERELERVGLMAPEDRQER